MWCTVCSLGAKFRKLFIHNLTQSHPCGVRERIMGVEITADSLVQAQIAPIASIESTHIQQQWTVVHEL